MPYMPVSVCEPGTYGSKCDKWCFCKDNKPCDRDSGRCPVEDLCQKGWQFSKCDFRGISIVIRGEYYLFEETK